MITQSTGDQPPDRWATWLDGRLIGRVDLVHVAPPRYGFGYWLLRLGFRSVAAFDTYTRFHLRLDQSR
jgi:hypothetical protein